MASLRNISFSYRRAMRNAPVGLSTKEYFLSCLKSCLSAPGMPVVALFVSAIHRLDNAAHHRGKS